jgi:hypothetical protein
MWEPAHQPHQWEPAHEHQAGPDVWSTLQAAAAYARYAPASPFGGVGEYVHDGQPLAQATFAAAGGDHQLAYGGGHQHVGHGNFYGPAQSVSAFGKLAQTTQPTHYYYCAAVPAAQAQATHYAQPAFSEPGPGVTWYADGKNCKSAPKQAKAELQRLRQAAARREASRYSSARFECAFPGCTSRLNRACKLKASIHTRCARAYTHTPFQPRLTLPPPP